VKVGIISRSVVSFLLLHKKNTSTFADVFQKDDGESFLLYPAYQGFIYITAAAAHFKTHHLFCFPIDDLENQPFITQFAITQQKSLGEIFRFDVFPVQGIALVIGNSDDIVILSCAAGNVQFKNRVVPEHTGKFQVCGNGGVQPAAVAGMGGIGRKKGEKSYSNDVAATEDLFHNRNFKVNDLVY